MTQNLGQNDESLTFVGREIFLSHLCAGWDLFVGREHTYSGFFIYAIAGMGKTWVLRTFYHTVCATRQPVLWLRILERGKPAPPLPQAPADLTTLAPALPEPPRRPLREGLAEVGEFLGMSNTLADLLPALDAYDLEFELPRPEFKLAPTESTGQRVAVCLDGIDLLERYEAEQPLPIGSASLWENLQEKWLLPLLKTGYCFTLLTGQGMPVWINWEVSRQIKPERLDQLKGDEVRQLLRAYELEASATALYQLSKGHPASVVFLAQHIRKIAPRSHRARSTPFKHAPVNIALLDDLREKEPEIYDALLTLAPIRRLDVPIMRRFATLENETIRALREQGVIESQSYGPAMMHIEPALQAWLLEQRQKNVASLADQYLHLAKYYWDVVTNDPLRGVERCIEWMYASLQYQLLTQDKDAKELKISWRNDFQELWDIIPQTEVSLAALEDLDVLPLLTTLHHDHVIHLIHTAASLEQDRERIKGELETFIQGRIPGQLAAEDWILLRELSYREGSFKVKDVQVILSRLRPQTEVTALAARKKIMALNIVYVTKKGEGGYILDDWLREYLRSDNH